MNELTTRTLEELEAVIEAGLRTFLEVGRAVLEIRERRLYREQGFDTFEDYCRQRWHWSKTHINRQINAAEVAGNLAPIGVKPRNEAQARELAPLPPEQQREVAAEIDFGTATAARIREKAQEVQKRVHAQLPVKATTAIKSPRRKQSHRELMADSRRVVVILSQIRGLCRGLERIDAANVAPMMTEADQKMFRKIGIKSARILRDFVKRMNNSAGSRREGDTHNETAA
jgi:hypothetical protein